MKIKSWILWFARAPMGKKNMATMKRHYEILCEGLNEFAVEAFCWAFDNRIVPTTFDPVDDRIAFILSYDFIIEQYKLHLKRN